MNSKYNKLHQVVNTDSRINEDQDYIAFRRKWDEVGAELYVTELPLHLDIEITNACNLKCVMCERKFMTREVGYMEMQLYKYIVDYCATEGINSIKLGLWGESILHPQFIDMIEYANEKGILNKQFNTNASLLDEQLAKRIVASGLDRLTLSIDSINKDNYEEIRVGSTIEKVNRNINSLIRAKEELGIDKPYITAQIIRMKRNKDRIDSFIDYYKNLVDYTSVTNIGVVSGDSDILKHALVKYDSSKRFPCPEIWHRMSIAHNGVVTVCCQDYNFMLKVGNIETNTIKEIWHSDQLNQLRSRHKELDFNGLLCETCTANCAFVDIE